MGIEVTVVQSYRRTDVPEWIKICMESVRSYAASKGYGYCFYDDEAVDAVLDENFLRKVGERWAMKTDLARLLFCRNLLNDGASRVVWLDADVLVIDPGELDFGFPCVSGFSFGREIWLEKSGKVRRGVHNAFCMFESGNPFLDFYIHACREIISRHEGEKLAPQLLGPKFLKMQMPFWGEVLDDQVEMWSPWVINDSCLYERQRELQGGDPVAANLCHSMHGEVDMVSFIDCILF